VLEAALRNRRCEVTIDNLANGVNRFPLTSAAAKDEDARDEMKMIVVGVVVAFRLIVFPEHDAGNADWLSAVAAKNSSKLGGLGDSNSSHWKDSLGDQGSRTNGPIGKRRIPEDQ
jgi:hypothetical protein